MEGRKTKKPMKLPHFPAQPLPRKMGGFPETQYEAGKIAVWEYVRFFFLKFYK
jgi:hypothetical protein